MRETIQRKIILEELKKSIYHPSADELYILVKKHIPNISLGTVYRNLEFLAESGIIRKLEYGSNQKRFDGNTEEHNHFRCTQCGCIDDIPFDINPAKPDANHTWVKKRIIQGYRLEFFGLCPDCARGNA